MNVKELLKKLFTNPYRKLGISKSEFNRIIGLPRYQPTTTNLFGTDIIIGDSVTFFHGLREIFLGDIYKFDSETNNPLIIDCGANIGLATIYFKRLYPNSKIIAIEADPKIFQTLSKNIESHNFSNIDISNVAVWDEETTISFQSEGGYSGRIQKPGDETNLIKVKTIRLKKLLDQPVDLLKLDIEGAENRVIKDCASLLYNVKHIFIEYHSHAKEDQDLGDILNILKTNNFRYYLKPRSSDLCKKR